MKIVITGNMGYIGPVLVHHLRSHFEGIKITGFDTGFFAHCLTGTDFFPEIKLDNQVYGDIRKFDVNLLKGADVVINLAAISNDPMGKQYEEVTMDINHKACITLAEMAKSEGVSHFVFASSCSMYGAGGDEPRTESSQLSPLTAYAKSKVAAENDLAPLADDNFLVTCLRFGTACGFSPRLRLDLVLNDFVAGAIVDKSISVLSDGTPWRPMINVKDMSRAMEWASTRTIKHGGAFLAVNTGQNLWNNQVSTLANAVKGLVEGTQVTINPDAPVDKRSYRVNFDLFESLAPKHQPIYNLNKTVEGLRDGLLSMNFKIKNYRESFMIRLKTLNLLQSKGRLNQQLNWK
jgi:nucleoside-diphosphate-sugar epimerase